LLDLVSAGHFTRIETTEEVVIWMG
jgi:hypothetical protein